MGGSVGFWRFEGGLHFIFWICVVTNSPYRFSSPAYSDNGLGDAPYMSEHNTRVLTFCPGATIWMSHEWTRGGAMYLRA